MCKYQNEVYKMLFLNICIKILYKKISSYSWGFCYYVKSEKV